MLETALELIRGNALVAYTVIAAVSFGESFAFLSLLVPGWAFMVAAGALVAQGVLHPLPVIAAAAIGATFGDSISYWIGLRFKNVVPRIWPFTRHTDWLDRGHDFFRKWGAMSVFLGRFFGPVRAVIPLAAGMMEMPAKAFWIANVGSAIPWAIIVVGTGWGGKELVHRVLGERRWDDPVTQIVLWSAIAVVIAGILLIRRWHAQRD